MSKRIWSLSLTAGCLTLVLCGLGAAFAGAGYMLINPPSPIPSPVNRIAIVDNDADIQVMDANGDNRIAITTDGAGSSVFGYTSPTWSPDNQQLAFIGIGNDLVPGEIAVYASSAKESKPIPVFRSALQSPFYLYWAPDSQSIGFLASSSTNMALIIANADGKTTASEIDTGSPFYWAWSPDSKTLLTHIGGDAHTSNSARMNLRKRQTNETSQVLKRRPASFQAPHYSPDGASILYATADDANGDALFIADAQDNNARLITNFDGAIAFAWSPNGNKIAYLITSDFAPLPAFGPITVSDADGKNRVNVTQEDALAFFWSPNSENIAFLTVAPGGQTSQCRTCNSRTLDIPAAQSRTVNLRWQVMNLATGRTRVLASFTPTRDLLNLIPYFDQYSRSLTFWSPDSTQFVYAKNDAPGNSTIWVANIDEKIAPRKIAEGTFAVWSWK